jgi:hypothetical protein
VTEKVILTTSSKNGPVKNMREKLCNRIHSFRCTTHQEISRDVIKRLELCQTSTVFVPESCIIDKLLLLILDTETEYLSYYTKIRWGPYRKLLRALHNGL